MSRLTLHMQSSLDGFVGRTPPDRNWQLWDWGPSCPWDDALRRAFNDQLSTLTDVVLSQQMAIEGYIDHWSRMAQAQAEDPTFRFAARIHHARKTLVTRHPDPQLRWPKTGFGVGSLEDVIATVKRSTDGHAFVFGGVGLASALLTLGVVDDFYCYVNPVPAGSGDRLPLDSAGAVMELREMTNYPCGISVQHFVRTAGDSLDVGTEVPSV